ncbi:MULTISPECIES: XkdX family protein [Tepidanaerobacter]|nr:MULTISPECIES: XkdX family protein [Tepidanaerobacter]HHV82749.1 XkdX family protein [Tepidanaerobacter syntrophicus]
MTDFEWCKFCYDKGWASKWQLHIWVQAGKITEEEFNTITSQET